MNVKKRWKRYRGLALIIAFLCITANIKVDAADASSRSVKKSAEGGGNYLLVEPDGGFNSAKISLYYEEQYYTIAGNRSNFNYRLRQLAYKWIGQSYYTLDFSNIMHTDGTTKKVITPYTYQSVWYDKNTWDDIEAYYNTSEYIYSQSTSYEGVVTFSLSAPDCVPNYCYDTARISLNTQ